ncbi:DUF1028 domain-containing protein [Micromonospora sp. C28SCA-DRY-2]|uniref:DUF1028 domain-containing protein n=1 Tax=Micromonospora sp. C28SCA-DRY-2 TaxID=3059522 RepID=UPI002675AA1E|nr:DUF1028 domain-containing protein [Micromonospora sp. C28SCA-DRY-2]MDO3700181.1 DUF1028 domain-containing protein [Micromonospora sp. C28SCA-DRY-2]
MTFSIAARCPRTGQLGVGALTARPAVGKLVAHVQSGGGAVATQATPNPFLAYDGLPLLREGRAPRDVLTELLARDPGREVRQVGMVDHQGRSHAFTGSRTVEWAGHHTGPGYAVQGNRLVGPETLAEIVRVFEESRELDLAERLVLAIEAGEEAGGDRHGARSATVTVSCDQPYPLWDMRVDDAEHPARELRRLYGVFREEVFPTIQRLPTREDPMGEGARQALG